MEEKTFEIKENRMIADNTFEMVLVLPEGTHGIERPGQFVNIKLEGFFLRRPISICSWDKNTLTLIYKVVGRGTEAMSSYEPGRRLNLLIPLGNGFNSPQSFGNNVDENGSRFERGTGTSPEIGDKPLLVGGGAGIPPMYGLCCELVKQGGKPTVVLGFNSENEAFYIDKFKELGADVVVCTADGSLGVKGFVTDGIKNLSYTYFYACGPEAMLKALDSAIDKGIGGQMSFEERMGCGFGACMGCSCKTKYGNKRICKEGPVLERGEIIW